MNKLESLKNEIAKLPPSMLVEVEGSGRIVAQVPPPGTSLAKVKVCRLTLDSEI